MIGTITFSVLFIIFAIICIICSDKNKDFFNGAATGIITISLGVIAILLYAQECCDRQPEAIDVYRGNTTLEITYKDSIPVDTTVIFKMN